MKRAPRPAPQPVRTSSDGYRVVGSVIVDVFVPDGTLLATVARGDVPFVLAAHRAGRA